jgi:hypothetical protein
MMSSEFAQNGLNILEVMADKAAINVDKTREYHY